jgi:hypothetical protein
MNFEQYQPLALKTESRPASIEMNQFALHALLELAIAAGNVMDQVKRRVFYGKAIDNAAFVPALEVIANIADFMGEAVDGPLSINERLNDDQMASERQAAEDPDLVSLDDRNLNIRLLHAALGRFTESTEQLEALKAQLEGKGLDIVNYAEESGDACWYDAIEVDELTRLTGGVISKSSIQLRNIEKLQGNGKLAGRYASGDFDAVRALRRDLDNERVILSKGL